MVGRKKIRLGIGWGKNNKNLIRNYQYAKNWKPNIIKYFDRGWLKQYKFWK